MAIEPGDDLLDAHGTFDPIAVKEEPENLPNRSRFAFFDFEAFLDALSASFDLYGAIPEGRFAAVPEALAGVLQHRPANMLGGLFAVEGIGCRENRFCELRGRSFAKSLGYRNKRYAMLLKPAPGDNISSGVTEKPRLAVNENDIEGGRIDAGRIHHPLKLRSFVIASAGTGIDKFPDDEPAALATITAGLGQLIGDRDVVLSLPRC
jgi:hypothetical protein